MIQRFTTLSSLAVLLALTSGGPSFAGVQGFEDPAAASHTPYRRVAAPLSKQQLAERQAEFEGKLREAGLRSSGAAEDHEQSQKTVAQGRAEALREIEERFSRELRAANEAHRNGKLSAFQATCDAAEINDGTIAALLASFGSVWMEAVDQAGFFQDAIRARATIEARVLAAAEEAEAADNEGVVESARTFLDDANRQGLYIQAQQFEEFCEDQMDFLRGHALYTGRSYKVVAEETAHLFRRKASLEQMAEELASIQVRIDTLREGESKLQEFNRLREELEGKHAEAVLRVLEDQRVIQRQADSLEGSMAAQRAAIEGMESQIAELEQSQSSYAAQSEESGWAEESSAVPSPAATSDEESQQRLRALKEQKRAIESLLSEREGLVRKMRESQDEIGSLEGSMAAQRAAIEGMESQIAELEQSQSSYAAQSEESERAEESSAVPSQATTSDEESQQRLRALKERKNAEESLLREREAQVSEMRESQDEIGSLEESMATQRATLKEMSRQIDELEQSQSSYAANSGEMEWPDSAVPPQATASGEDSQQRLRALKEQKNAEESLLSDREAEVRELRGRITLLKEEHEQLSSADLSLDVAKKYGLTDLTKASELVAELRKFEIPTDLEQLGDNIRREEERKAELIEELASLKTSYKDAKRALRDRVLPPSGEEDDRVAGFSSAEDGRFSEMFSLGNLQGTASAAAGGGSATSGAVLSPWAHSGSHGTMGRVSSSHSGANEDGGEAPTALVAHVAGGAGSGSDEELSNIAPASSNAAAAAAGAGLISTGSHSGSRGGTKDKVSSSLGEHSAESESDDELAHIPSAPARAASSNAAAAAGGAGSAKSGAAGGSGTPHNSSNDSKKKKGEGASAPVNRQGASSTKGFSLSSLFGS